LEIAKEQAIATFESLAIHTDLPGSSPSNSESSSDQEEEEEMAANEFMGDLDIPTIPASPSSILLPTVARNYELKSSHLNMLPSFYGLPNEDPLTHIKDIFNESSKLFMEEYTESSKSPFTPKATTIIIIGGYKNEDEEETTATKGEQPDMSQSAPKAKSNSQEPNPFQLHKRDDKFVPSHLHEDRCIPPPPYIPPIPFPGRLKKVNQDKAFKDIYDILSKVNINLLLLDVVKQIPAYGKFINHLMTHKLNFAPSEEVKLNKNVSAVLQRKLPPKLEDPGSFDIPINIGDKKVGRAMLDLGASINVMPYSVYQELGLEGIKKTSIRLELADHSIKYPRGIVEDILVQVNTLILPADFVVMDMEDNPHGDRVDPILLGRPFMATADTIIKVKDGTLSMTVLGETSNDALEAVLTQEEEDLYESEFQEVMAALEVFQPYPPSFRPPLEPLGPSSTKLEPSIITPPKLEVKPPPPDLN
ncbi:unnamed protein product, partial [Prunus brigantina]